MQLLNNRYVIRNCYLQISIKTWFETDIVSDFSWFLIYWVWIFSVFFCWIFHITKSLSYLTERSWNFLMQTIWTLDINESQNTAFFFLFFISRFYDHYQSLLFWSIRNETEDSFVCMFRWIKWWVRFIIHHCSNFW